MEEGLEEAKANFSLELVSCPKQGTTREEERGATFVCRMSYVHGASICLAPLLFRIASCYLMMLLCGAEHHIHDIDQPMQSSAAEEEGVTFEGSHGIATTQKA